MPTALLLVNIHSRNGEENLHQVRECLESQGISILTPETGSREDIGRAIVRHANEVDMVVMGGGDGSLNCAADALARTGLPLGIIPLGTANDLARTLAIPTDIPEACELIRRGHTSKIDLGYVNGTGFFNVANIGLGVEVMKQLSGPVKKWWGPLSYAKVAFGASQTQRPFHVSIRCNDRDYKMRVLQVAIGNGRYYGGGMVVHEDASLTDGTLDLYAIRARTFLQLIGLSPMLGFFTSGKMKPIDGVEQLSGKSMTLSTIKPMPVSADGEEVAYTPAEFTVKPAAVTVFTPAGDAQ